MARPSTAWLREDRPDVAVEKILDGAERAFIELGVSRAGMANIAEYAGCSRGTLYRYFGSRHELHLAYINRSAIGLVARLRAGLAAIEDPGERLVEGIIRAVREVRDDPATAAWFAPAESGIAARMSRCSEVIDALARAFVAQLLAPSDENEQGHLASRWLVRIIISLLTLPGEDAAEERALVERFVAPALLRSLES